MNTPQDPEAAEAVQTTEIPAVAPAASCSSGQEPEQEQCGITHYAGCECHEKGWENKWKIAIEMAAQASVERDEYRRIAGELVAAIRVNTMRGTFATTTIEDVDQWLKQWTDKFGPKPAICPTNAEPTSPPNPNI